MRVLLENECLLVAGGDGEEEEEGGMSCEEKVHLAGVIFGGTLGVFAGPGGVLTGAGVGSLVGSTVGARACKMVRKYQKKKEKEEAPAPKEGKGGKSDSGKDLYNNPFGRREYGDYQLIVDMDY